MATIGNAQPVCWRFVAPAQGHEHGIVHAKALTGLDLDLAVLKGILTQDDAVHTLALEVDLQCSQGDLGDVLDRKSVV